MEIVKIRDYSEDLSVDVEDSIKVCFTVMGFEVSFHLVQDRDKWRALVKTVMNLRVP
jgi:hypothetical protein